MFLSVFYNATPRRLLFVCVKYIVSAVVKHSMDKLG